ncbi:MAG TPA: hypothetical protein VMW27_31085 [Thermoanaerobaculia bacterium]|nr:hypothetical protein [Thermoanaerobaculia bacterium]
MTEPTEPVHESAPRRWSVLVLYMGPLLAVLVLAVLPVIRGLETFYLRDVLNAHLPMKWAQAEAMREGYFPLLDPYRAGGQPIAGNLNAVPFYPDNLLYFVASPIRALNAHFWIHLLLAPFVFYWMARTWGLRREAACAGAALYTLSGYFLSNLSFYNLIAGVALAPALVAACLRLARPDRPAWSAPAVAALWALLLVSGDPLMAFLAGLLAASAVLIEVFTLNPERGGGASPPGRGTEGSGGGQVGGSFEAAGEIDEISGSAAEEPPPPDHPRSLPTALPGGEAPPPLSRPKRVLVLWRSVLLPAAAALCGTLIALPQITEFLRILPISYRGQRGYADAIATLASWDPRQIFEWFLPMVFGRLDLLGKGGFWGGPYFTGIPPYYVSLYPGLLALALWAGSGRPRGRVAWWAWGSLLAGIFFSLGRFNPVAEWLFTRGGSLRYPVKLWLPVAMGMALLGALGFEKLLVEDLARRRVRFVLLALAVGFAGLWAFLTLFPGPAEAWLRITIPKSFDAAFLRYERQRWAGLCLFSLAALAALGIAMRVLRRRPALGGALLLAVYAVTQVLLLRPAFPTDAVQPYLVPPPALAYVPRGLIVFNPDLNHLFGRSTLRAGNFPQRTAAWMERRAFYELYWFTGPMWKRRFDLNVAPEGLDTYLARLAQGAIKASDNDARLRMLGAWGVGRLLLNKPLEPQPARARLITSLPSFGKRLYIYEVTDRAPEVYLARRVFLAPHLNAAWKTLTHKAFDTRADAVIQGKGTPETAGGGRARLLRNEPEALDIAVDAVPGGPGGQLLVVQRAYHPIWKATVDGRPATVLPANLYRMAVRVPAGSHRVRLAVDRGPFHRALAGTALGVLLLPVLAVWAGRSRKSREQVR